MSEATFPVEIDPGALEPIRRLLARNTGDAVFLRIGVKGGGCSGLEYVLQADTEAKPIDLVWEGEGVRVHCDAKSARFLAGSRLVYTGNLIGSGFKFVNPNEGRSCGCGTSFSPK